MSYIPAVDCSQWQGNIDWSAVTCPIAVIKMSGGDNGLYLDTKANQNYYGAQAAGKAIGMYHFAGGTDPIAEADYFVNACSPLAENDVLVLDWEVQHPDPVGWCTAFVNRVHDKTGAWCLFYANGSTFNAYDWSPVTNNCGRWVAWYGRNPEDNLPVPSPYVMHQYTSDGSMPGIAGRVDLNAWFGTLDQFKAYGYRAVPPPPPAPQPIPAPQPAPTPVQPTPPTTDPAPAPEPTPPPAVTPEPTPEPQPTPVVVTTPKQPWWAIFILWLLSIFTRKSK